MMKTMQMQMMALALSLLMGIVSSHGFFRGYKNSRSWGTAGQSKTMSARRGRQQQELGFNSLLPPPSPPTPCTCTAREEAGGAVCGTDGVTYTSPCLMRKSVCRQERRQGRSFNSPQLKVEISHGGPCTSPCAGMDQLGHFQAFGSKATNSGLCVHDFFKCAMKLRSVMGRANPRVQTCCQARFDQCARS